MEAKKHKHTKSKKHKRSSISPLLIIVVALMMVGSYMLGYHSGAGHKINRNILLVNEKHTLNASYVPEDLVNLYEMRHSFRLSRSDIQLTRTAYTAAQEMFAAAEAENVNGFYITSGYRSYERQAEVYAESEAGYAQKPGCSEHQTGLAFDVTAENVNGFENTAQYTWLQANAYKYGFIQRYPAGKSDITGISYEPWHYRYVGVEAATYIRNNNITLEEYPSA